LEYLPVSVFFNRDRGNFTPGSVVLLKKVVIKLAKRDCRVYIIKIVDFSRFKTIIYLATGE
jgi:hypothetical protein